MAGHYIVTGDGGMGIYGSPLNPTGKIDRVGLKGMAEDHLHPHGLS